MGNEVTRPDENAIFYKPKTVKAENRYPTDPTDPVQKRSPPKRSPRDELRSAERKEAERRSAERRSAERKEAERRSAERRSAERRSAERRSAERRSAERRSAERRSAERKEAERRSAERRSAERRSAERRSSERKDAAKLDSELKEAERLNAERRSAERKQAERRSAERKEAEQKEAEVKRHAEELAVIAEMEANTKRMKEETEQILKRHAERMAEYDAEAKRRAAEYDAEAKRRAERMAELAERMAEFDAETKRRAEKRAEEAKIEAEKAKIEAEKKRIASQREAERLALPHENEEKLYELLLRILEKPLPNISELLTTVKSTYLDRTGSLAVPEQSLPILFKIIDDMYFNGLLTRTIAEKKSTLRIIYSYEDTDGVAASCYSQRKCEYLITMSKKYFVDEDLFELRKKRTSNGVRCNDLFECLLNIFQHEITHLAFYIVSDGLVTNRPGIVYQSLVKFSPSNSLEIVTFGQVGHSESFQTFVLHAFGHTSFTHRLDKREAEISADLSETRKILEGVNKHVQEMKKTVNDERKRNLDRKQEVIESLGPDMLNVIRKKDITKQVRFGKADFAIGMKLRIRGTEWTITKLNEKSVAIESGKERKLYTYIKLEDYFSEYIYWMHQTKIAS